jgi:hypothetical protein
MAKIKFKINSLLKYTTNQKSQPWFILWVSSSIFINPFLKIALGREIWNLVNIVWVILLIISFYIDRKNVE